MRKVELAPGVHSSILGFGCAPILGAVDGTVARRAINCALDCGITHFDLARSYGYGEAESFVGKLLKGRRHQVIITSKFGIRANWKASLLKPLKPLVRVLRGGRKRTHLVDPPGKPAVPSMADPFHDRIPITPQSMGRSLEVSLKSIGTDYLDILLVHEPLQAVDDLEQLVEAAEGLKKAGKIRAFGLAFPWSLLDSHKSYLQHFDLLQFDNSMGAPHYGEVRHLRSDARNIFFSPLRNSRAEPEEILATMWTDFQKSVILCSMFREEHIRKNVQTALLSV